MGTDGNRTWERLNPKLYMSRRTVTSTSWIAFFLALFSFLLLLTAMATPGWAWTHEMTNRAAVKGEVYGQYGLWYSCFTLVSGDGGVSCSLATSMSDVPGWWQACQALSVIMLVSIFLAVFFIGAYIFSKALNINVWIVGAATACALLAACAGCAMFVVFAAKFINDFYWCCKETNYLIYYLTYSFYISVASSVLAGTTAIVCLFETLRVQQAAAVTQMMEQRSADQYYPGY